MKRYETWRELISDLGLILAVVGTTGIALKYTTFFNKWVFFPFFPNICDSAFLIVSVLFLAWRAKRRK